MRYNAIILEALAADCAAWKGFARPVYATGAGYGPPRHRNITGPTSQAHWDSSRIASS